jgi:major vault protein
MVETRMSERDLVLNPNEFVFISDSTNGQIRCAVGPYKANLPETDYPVIFREDTKQFVRVELFKAIQLFAIAPEGWYIILKNPSEEHPLPAKPNAMPSLEMGRKVNIPGPNSFALWPGQMKKVVKGHYLRSNQYLLVRVYDEGQAKQNWTKAIIKPQEGSKEETKTLPLPDITIGRLLVIKGTEISFYIPPTGVEVVSVADKQYIRDAVTLETLEYCILLGENGEKRYIKGPAVVFPEPTETFIEQNGSKKFKAYELNEISGIYLKVISEYKEGEVQHTAGDELFITGKEQAIYFPRPEHAIIKYGDKEIHHAIAIPAGEGRYVLDRLGGQISLVKGPKVFLPDPRAEVIVRRVLNPNLCDLWFPGNLEAITYNKSLLMLLEESKALGPQGAVGAPGTLGETSYVSQQLFAARSAPVAAKGMVADDFKRGTSYTPPRTITLDTKYEGAVSINVWTGYAILITSKTGKREVVIGPTTVLLEYDETLESMELSTGTPKVDSKLFKTAYLRVLNNKVSDIIDAETSDLCPVKILVSYRVNFEGNKDKWFDVENYVKFLTDHLRSLIRNAVKQCSISDFYGRSIAIIRDCVLGVAKEDTHQRPGRNFDENGMRVYECEVLNVEISNPTVQKMLIDAQTSSIQYTISLAKNKSSLDYTIENEEIKRHIRQEEHDTFKHTVGISIEYIELQMREALAKVKAKYESEKQELVDDSDRLVLVHKNALQELETAKASNDQAVIFKKEQQLLDIEKMQAQTEAEIKKLGAVSTELISALQSFGDKATLESLAKSMSPMAILGGESLVDVMNKLLKGTKLEGLLAKVEKKA